MRRRGGHSTVNRAVPALTRHQDGLAAAAKVGLLVGEKSELASVPSCPVHAEAAHVVDQRPILPSLPPCLPPLYRRAIGTRPTRRNATQRDPTTPSDPNPAQPNPSHPNPKLARLVPRQEAPAAWSPSPESRQVGASLEIQRSSSRKTQDRSRPGRQTTSSQYLSTLCLPAYLHKYLPRRKSACPPGSGHARRASVSATHRASPRQSLPARTTSLYLYSPHPNKTHLLILSCPALILHRISARYTPRRAAPPACLPASVELRGTHSLTVRHHAVALVLPTPALSWTLPRVPVSPLSPTFRPSSLHTACITRPSLP